MAVIIIIGCHPVPVAILAYWQEVDDAGVATASSVQGNAEDILGRFPSNGAFTFGLLNHQAEYMNSIVPVLVLGENLS